MPPFFVVFKEMFLNAERTVTIAASLLRLPLFSLLQQTSCSLVTTLHWPWPLPHFSLKRLCDAAWKDSQASQDTFVKIFPAVLQGHWWILKRCKRVRKFLRCSSGQNAVSLKLSLVGLLIETCRQAFKEGMKNFLTGRTTILF